MSRRSLVIGLTGNIATGKSTILNYLMEKCAFIIDADKLGHRVIEPGGQAYDAVVRTFGREILREDGTIDRARFLISGSGNTRHVVIIKSLTLNDLHDHTSPKITFER